MTTLTDAAKRMYDPGRALAASKEIPVRRTTTAPTRLSLGDFRLLRQFSYPGEGWGITTDGHEVFMSDGTPEIRVLDSNTLIEKRRFKVRDGTKLVTQLNELEFVDGEIFANIWQTDRIARISPQTGEVVGWIDLTGLLSPMYRTASDAVLNGIAYDRQTKRLFVTGKLWPSIFEIRVIPKHLDHPL